MADAPQIITARSIGLAFQNLFGELGPELSLTGHYSAGARAADWRQGVERAKSFHAFHRGKGWGGVGYHFIISDDGALICARPTLLKGAHTGAHNTSNLGVNCPGTTGDDPTPEQRATYRWLLENAHTDALPAAHRSDRDLRQARLFGHRSWSGHETNACPGLFLEMYRAGLARAGESEDLQAPPGPARYPEPTRHGTTDADYRHVAPEEAEAARNTDQVDEELPGEDPRFDEELELTQA